MELIKSESNIRAVVGNCTDLFACDISNYRAVLAGDFGRRIHRPRIDVVKAMANVGAARIAMDRTSRTDKAARPQPLGLTGRQIHGEAHGNSSGGRSIAVRARVPEVAQR